MLLNVKNTKVELGQILSDYRDFAKDFDPATKGLTLSNSDQIREVHNSFARQTQYELDVKGGKEEDNYHFISYIPHGDKVLELDGLRDFPLEVAQVKEGSDWLDAVRPVIQMRIQKWVLVFFNVFSLSLSTHLDPSLSTYLDPSFVVGRTVQ